MDADNSPVRRAAPAQGGTVEPANRAPVAMRASRRRTRPLASATSCAIRSPRSPTGPTPSPEMVAKAEQLGSTRFVAVAEDGKRTTDPEGRRRVAARASSARRRPSARWTRCRRVTRCPRRRTSSRCPAPPRRRAQPEQVDGKAIAKIDAQAERTALVARLEAALTDRYIIKRAPVTVGDVTIGRTEYRFRGDTSRVAFTESTFRLATDTNSPSVARSMVDVAEARNWKALRVSGNEDFKRMVWLEASVRGVKTLGYEPNPGDLEVLKREREARLVNRIEPARDASGGAAAAPAEKASARGGGGRKAVLAAIEAVLVAKKVPEKQRAAVMAAATEKLAQRIRDGQVPKVKVYDKAAPSQRPVVVPTPELQRSRERAAPAPVR